ncbi:hypothetical protein MBEHAL_1464 [Halarchaeum acidiphilum MH1-52-1]|uniref:Uncharacterized protein n=1 Tax=Halarchaeum acidiphilum MH1-52-1 TaxID=1261545 RepID=U3A4Y3_9EURY|nr:hypothetical protein [Halarchaeum acidiphilum]GAD52704.1 hypothetical protein MBEHAL_1464 [Halarchaeum acidiphilum MH1-52-1]
MHESIARFVDDAREHLGDDLQAVVYGDVEEKEYSVAYARTGFGERQEIEEVSNVVEEHTLERIEVPYQESLHPTLGDLEVTIRVYEEGINVLGWGWNGESSLVVVYLDRDASALPWIVEQIEAFGE